MLYIYYGYIQRYKEGGAHYSRRYIQPVQVSPTQSLKEMVNFRGFPDNYTDFVNIYTYIYIYSSLNANGTCPFTSSRFSAIRFFLVVFGRLLEYGQLYTIYIYIGW